MLRRSADAGKARMKRGERTQQSNRGMSKTATFASTHAKWSAKPVLFAASSTRQTAGIQAAEAMEPQRKHDQAGSEHEPRMGLLHENSSMPLRHSDESRYIGTGGIERRQSELPSLHFTGYRRRTPLGS
jgi:hypothetical protein